jgi:hypothetical protein
MTYRLLLLVAAVAAVIAPLENGDFESRYDGWTWSALADTVYCGTEYHYPNHGDCYAWFGGLHDARDVMWQDVDLRDVEPPVQLKVCWDVETEEGGDAPYDVAALTFQDPGTATTLAIVQQWDNTDAGVSGTYTCQWHTVPGLAGRVVRLHLEARTDHTLLTNFFFDDLLLLATVPGEEPHREHKVFLPLMVKEERQ